MVFLLPYIEQDNLLRLYNIRVGFGADHCEEINGPVFKTVVKLYQCPADSGGSFTDPAHDTTGSRSNYVGCFSPDWGWAENGAPVILNHVGSDIPNPTSKVALFNFNRKRRLADISDGTSNTIIVSELITGPDGSFDLRGVWWHEYGVMYTHHLSPNSPLPDEIEEGHCPTYCDSSKAPIVGDTPAWKLANFAARSYHPGGVNVVLADGSVRFVNNDIDLPLWHDLASRLKRRGLIVVLSDCFDQLPALLRALRHFRHRRHEVLLFHILAPEELEFPFSRMTQFRNLERLGHRILVDPGQLRKEYRKNFDAFCTQLREQARQMRIDYQMLRTDEGVDRALGAYLAKRQDK